MTDPQQPQHQPQQPQHQPQQPQHQPWQPQGQPPQPQPMYSYPQQLPQQMPAGPQNGMAIAGLVLGIVATVIALIPFGIFFIWPASVLAIVFGAIGHNRANRGLSDKKREAVAGWILGIASMVAAPIIWSLIFAAMVGGSAATVGY